jgi:hypothetical protein
MKLHEFYRKFEDMPKEERYALIEFTPEPSSFFVIFQKLTQIKQQKRRLEEQEEHLLDQVEEALKKKKNG